MGKDPAVLFYTSDFLSGTMTMTDEQVGKYIRLLCLQHQKGHLTEKDMTYICKTYDEDVYGKFTKEDGKYYNIRMREEGEKRRSYSESRRNNRTKGYEQKKDPTYVEHMENENENEDVNEDVIKNTIEQWNDFAGKNGIAQVKEINKKRKTGIEKCRREKLFKLDDILREIEQSDFLRGSSGWRVTFDFVFCSPSNYLKILEGNYRNGTVKKSTPSSATERAQFRHTEQQIKNNESLLESLRHRDRERGKQSGLDTEPAGNGGDISKSKVSS